MIPLRGFAAIALLVGSAGGQCFAAVVYETTPYTFREEGYSYVGGTITTNGMFGEINATNVSTFIVDWDLTFTSPVKTYTLTHLNSTVSYADDFLQIGSPNLQATPERLIFPSFPVSTEQDYLFFTSGNQRIAFLSQPPDVFAKMILSDKDYFISDAFSTELQSSMSSNIIATAAAVSVPEPSTVCILSLIAVACVSTRRTRRKQQAISAGDIGHST